MFRTRETTRFLGVARTQAACADRVVFAQALQGVESSCGCPQVIFGSRSTQHRGLESRREHVRRPYEASIDLANPDPDANVGMPLTGQDHAWCAQWVNCVKSGSAQRRPADIFSIGRIFSQVPVADFVIRHRGSRAPLLLPPAGVRRYRRSGRQYRVTVVRFMSPHLL